MGYESLLNVLYCFYLPYIVMVCSFSVQSSAQCTFIVFGGSLERFLLNQKTLLKPVAL